ncbi:DUF2894 domain-containing protein [Paraburkholderia kururiensis]|uniref:DUF2894 domain-containing protein n=1 Tax=Paraburkholderia kururiensis TaxID=984307 RepID=A0ABZ0WIN3_9BURK|nr:DUF2894 domain-containing protein [Paraburkholderia kururiensis]WQD77210.1 DUF2894 domain-containing protein [Paraburkholderia kururiensis]
MATNTRPDSTTSHDATNASDVVTQAQSLLDSWRERGAHRVAPMRFRFIDALSRRAAAHSGATRHLLDEKLAQALDEYTAELARAGFDTAKAEPVRAASPPREPVRGALFELLDQLASQDRKRDAGHTASLRANTSSWPEMELLDYFRATWSRLSAERQLRQSEDRVPRNAGPLNSSSLVHRSLSLMRELSPGYLQHFLSYVDALSWIEQMNGAAVAPKEVPRAANTAGAKKGERSRAR